VDPSGIITTVVGSGSTNVIPAGTTNYEGTDSAVATAALLNSPRDVKFDIFGNLFITDASNNILRKYVPSTGKVYRFAGVQYTFVNPGTSSGDGGLALNCHLSLPARLSYDGASLIYVSDQNYNNIRQISLANGIISRVAGTTTTVNAFSGNGGPALSANLAAPAGIGSDNFGNFYIADGNNHQVRVVASQGSLAITISGAGTGVFCTGTPITLTSHTSISGSATYSWYRNNTLIAGATSATYSNSSPVNGDNYYAIVTVTPACGSPFNDTSNVINLTIERTASAVAIVGANTICASGPTVTLMDSASGGVWTSSNPSVATIGSSTGIVTGLTSGVTTITYAVQIHVVAAA
jgi:hypothetical protein